MTEAKMKLTKDIEERGPAKVISENPRNRERNHSSHVTSRVRKNRQVTALQRGRPPRPNCMRAGICNTLQKKLILFDLKLREFYQLSKKD